MTSQPTNWVNWVTTFIDRWQLFTLWTCRQLDVEWSWVELSCVAINTPLDVFCVSVFYLPKVENLCGFSSSKREENWTPLYSSSFTLTVYDIINYLLIYLFTVLYLPPTKEEVYIFARVCLFVCLSVSKITHKCVHGFGSNVACRQMSGHRRTDFFNFWARFGS